MNPISETSIIQPKYYTLSEISKWQLDENSTIKSPSLQRGFVWKAHQIEALWDSILRGYPIGAVMMSVDTENNERFLLLHRACSYYNNRINRFIDTFVVCVQMGS